MPGSVAMIVAGHLLLEDGPQRCRLSPGRLRVRDGVIEEVVEGEIPASPDLGGANSIISPGFIDAHLHLPQFDMIGAHGLPLMRWLSEVTFPAEMKWQDADYARGMTHRVIAQLLSLGTTGICAFATVHHDSAVAAIEVARDAGVRGVIGQVLMDREAPSDLCRDTGQLLDEAAELAAAFPADQRMAAAVTPRFAVTCTEKLLTGAGQIASQSNCLIQSHLAETANECALVADLFDGRRYVDVYDQCGLLTDKSVHGHGIHLHDGDRRTLSRRGATVAHCPTANTFLRSGTMNLAALRSDGVSIAVGSDIGAGYERSMIRVARAMIEAAASIGNELPDAATAWHAITAGNADALGWHDAGRLKVGASADLVVVEPNIPLCNGNRQHGDVEPLAKLLWAWDDRWVRNTMVKGQLTVDG